MGQTSLEPALLHPVEISTQCDTGRAKVYCPSHHPWTPRKGFASSMESGILCSGVDLICLAFLIGSTAASGAPAKGTHGVQEHDTTACPAAVSATACRSLRIGTLSIVVALVGELALFSKQLVVNLAQAMVSHFYY